MNKYVVTSIFVFFLLASPSSVQAISDTFQVRMLVGTDTVPPTIPSSLTATPVAQTQIDLSWGASTDDFILSGYQVFRNSVQIATTTQTTYSDSGLTAGTSYTYFVNAFDSSFNYSSSSNVVSTSTFVVTPSSTPQPQSSGGLLEMKLVSFSIVPTQERAQIQWSTTRNAQFQLRWGRTTSYELGFLQNQIFKKQHSSEIADLEPGTIYEYELVGYDSSGRKTVLKSGQFSTSAGQDTEAPPNVSNLQAVIDGTHVRLTWTNPQSQDFSQVRIVRNYLFYPNDPNDGFVPYVGTATAYTDTDAVAVYPLQYYTVFAYDTTGNVSSGAVVAVRSLQGVGQNPTSTTDTLVAPSMQLDFNDIEFIQQSAPIANRAVDAAVPMTVRIAYEKLPEHLKTVTLTFQHPDTPQLTFTFLLRVNKDKTFYEATIAPLVTEGVYPVILSVFDFQTQSLMTVTGSLFVTDIQLKRDAPLSVPFMTTTNNQDRFSVGILLLFLMSCLYLLYRIVFGGKPKKSSI